MANPKIKSTPITRKEYVYELDGVRLSFSLRQDNSKELLTFKELLVQSLSDVEADIQTIIKSHKTKK